MRLTNSVSLIIVLFYNSSMQYTNSGTDEDADNDAYVQLGNVSSVDLVSFAYQIASGMVRILTIY